MDSSKNGSWIIPFKKFGRLKVKNISILYVMDFLDTVYISALVRTDKFKSVSIYTDTNQTKINSL